jgi:hypothetical protein
MHKGCFVGLCCLSFGTSENSPFPSKEEIFAVMKLMCKLTHLTMGTYWTVDWRYVRDRPVVLVVFQGDLYSHESFLLPLKTVRCEMWRWQGQSKGLLTSSSYDNLFLLPSQSYLQGSKFFWINCASIFSSELIPNPCR